jgi:hypothetical protein
VSLARVRSTQTLDSRWRGNDALQRHANRLQAADYFFSTFQRNVTGDTITPERLLRNAVGMMNCAVGM